MSEDQDPMSRAVGYDGTADRPAKARPGRVTDAMVEAFEVAGGRDALAGGTDPIRAGLVAAFAQREIETRRVEAESDECKCSRRERMYCHSTKCHGGADLMSREQRIAELTRDLLDEIVEESHVSPASVGDVADEIARFVVELTDSGAARGLASEVVARLALRPNPEIPRTCRQGEHRDMNVKATHRVAYVGPRGGDQQWTTDVCERHANIIRARMIRQGNRNVFLRPAGWTPETDKDAAKILDPLPGMREASDLYGGEADGYHRP